MPIMRSKKPNRKTLAGRIRDLRGHAVMRPDRRGRRDRNLFAGLAAPLAFLALAAGAMTEVAHANTAPATMVAGARETAGTTATIIKGRILFNRDCQMCHNQRGVGGKCPTLVRGAWAPGGPNGASFMFTTITRGRPGTEMPSWAPVLSPRQIHQIVAYLRHESIVIAAQDRKQAQSSHFERRG